MLDRSPARLAFHAILLRDLRESCEAKARLAFLLLTGAALTGCATIAGTVGQSWTTALVGNQEVPRAGDPDGTGTAKVTADATTNTVCVDIAVRGISAPTMAHIHRGALGVAGPPVLPLTAPVSGTSKECLSVEKALAAAIIAAPYDYYVNVHNADYPGGAIRGQLAAN